MTSKIIKSALLGGIAVFTWIYISWMVLPWHGATVHQFNNQEEIRVMLQAGAEAAESGIYAVPAMHKGTATPGPRAFIAYTPESSGKFNPMNLVKEFILDIIISGLVAFLLLIAKIENYGCRLKFAMIVGLVASLSAYVPNWIWWQFADEFVLVGIADTLIMSLVGGLVIAKFTQAE